MLEPPKTANQPNISDQQTASQNEEAKYSDGEDNAEFKIP